MRNAYALLGLLFLLVFGGAYFLTQKDETPPEDLNLSESNMTMKLTSSAFADGEMIPNQYSCDGENVNPPLEISEIPAGTESLVLLMDDPDIPQVFKDTRGIEKFDHWVVYNLPPNIKHISAGSEDGRVGINSRDEANYTGPCPPTEYEPTTHRYIFRLYALSEKLEFEKPPTLDELEKVAESVMIEKAELVGLFTRVTDTVE